MTRRIRIRSPFDTTLHNKNSKVIDVSSEAGVVRKYNASTLEYLRPSNEDEHTLANTCMHVDASGRINIGRKKKQVQAQNQIRFISEFDMRTMVQEIKREKYEIKASIECYSVLIVGGKIHSVHATKNYGYLIGDMEGVKRRIKVLGFMFLFQPHKYHASANVPWSVWSLLCLKEVGWGPPEQLKEIMAHQIIVQAYLELDIPCNRLHAKNKACNLVGLGRSFRFGLEFPFIFFLCVCAAYKGQRCDHVKRRLYFDMK